jgi:hypothetical protein
VRSLAVTSRLQQVTAVVTSVQATAYGRRGSVLAKDNLLLAGNQLFWIFLDPALRSFGLLRGESTGFVTWLAPLGTLLTGHLMLGNRQHVRFISGMATFVGKTRLARISLEGRIAGSLWPDFQRRTDVPVTTVVLDPEDGLGSAAIVREGVLQVLITVADDGPDAVELPTTVRVAWMVDTGADVG